LNLGNKKITITGDFVQLAGFMIASAPAIGIEVGSSSRVFFERISAESCGLHGFYFNGAGNDCVLDRCVAMNNTGDGLRIASGVGRVQVMGGLYFGNTGFGVNDLANSSILNGPRVAGNTAGQVNGTPAQDHAVTT